MTALLLFIKHHYPYIWLYIEKINGLLFAIRFPNFKNKAKAILTSIPESHNHSLLFLPITETDLPQLSEWLQQLPDSYQKYFHPHGFDMKSLTHIFKNPAYFMIKVCNESKTEKIFGYHFIRAFCTGSAFHGRIVDPSQSGKGIGTSMWRIAYQIAERSSLVIYSTISIHNQPSLKSIQKAVMLEECKKLPNDFRLFKITGLRP